MTRDEFMQEMESRVSDVNCAFEQVESASSCSCADDDLDDAINKAELDIENVENALEYLKYAVQHLRELKDEEIEEEERDGAQMREVYIKNDALPIPENMIEFVEFWETHDNDNGYNMVYVDSNNNIIQ